VDWLTVDNCRGFAIFDDLLHDCIRIPILGLADHNPHGAALLATYCAGGVGSSLEAQNLGRCNRCRPFNRRVILIEDSRILLNLRISTRRAFQCVMSNGWVYVLLKSHNYLGLEPGIL
jgi:hypothetical protein